MKRCRLWLIAVAAALLVFDLSLILSGSIGQRDQHFDGRIGFDGHGISLEIPVKRASPTWADGDWTFAGSKLTNPREFFLEAAKRDGNSGLRGAAPIIVISLGEPATFGRYLEATNALRSMGLCLVVIREGGQYRATLNDGQEWEISQAQYLCNVRYGPEVTE